MPVPKALGNNTEYSTWQLSNCLNFLLTITIKISSFSNSNDLEDKILLNADYPDPAEAPSNLYPDVPSTIPTLLIPDLATIAKDDGSKHRGAI